MDGCFNSGLSIGFGHILDDIDTGYSCYLLQMSE